MLVTLVSSALVPMQMGPRPTLHLRAARRIAMDEASDREALRLPRKKPPDLPSDEGDPLGGDPEKDFLDAQYRVRRRAEAGEYDKDASSRSLPLIALLAQVFGGGALCIGFGYCWLVRNEADAGTTWAIEALANSNSWWFGPAKMIFSVPPGGPLTLGYAAFNGVNALRCLPLLFDRVLVSRLPNDDWREDGDS